ncbi:FT-interacting protein 4-like [Gastrolobium bilobum]|uniref:FT-interacting protein 4-like n=1 Tax=Gastrolobium bilobum TaxID=150636 RepID=UPI002AB1A785|nr:FT-interacting protein 4-like [Gastrolobium bilobum]
MAHQKVDSKLKDISPSIGANMITGATDLIEINSFFYVRIVRARYLFVRNGPNHCDPYVEVRVGRFQGTTPCIRSSIDPVWNHVFALEIGQTQIHETILEIFVKNNIPTYDEYIGRISFDISDIPIRPPSDCALQSQWYEIEDLRGKQFRGELMLSCWKGTQADEGFYGAWHLQTDAASIGVYNIDNTRSRMYIMPKIWCLRVNLIQAHGLLLEDESEKSSIFIRATLGNLTFTSKLVENNNGNPKWNEQLLIAVAEPFDNQRLFFSVEKGTLTSHKSLGTCVFLVENADKVSPISVRTIVVEQNGGFAGKISMMFYLDGGYHIFDDDPHYSTDLNPPDKKLRKPPIGVFEMGILNARGLPAIKARGRTDAYCVAKYGPKWIRTRTVVNSLSPNWNEQCAFDVYDPCTFITISVFDNGLLYEGDIASGAKDTGIGKVRIRLSDMETNKIYSYSYPLFELQPCGLIKMGQIQLAFKFCCLSKLNLYFMYALTKLPKQHYAKPLSPTQLHGLRKQSVMFVSSKLSKSEPPMRREVVEYVLDSREIMWSMRRARADFERINILVSGLVALYTRFDEICKWENPNVTVMVIVVVIVVPVVLDICSPLPQHLFWHFILCIYWGWKYANRPKKLAHVNLELSNVHTASVDELEEEFDPIPTRFGDNVIRRNRYDRLRIVAGKYAALMGDFATIGEKLQYPLSWQDPTVTMLVMIACLIVGFLILRFSPSWSFPFPLRYFVILVSDSYVDGM